LISTYRYSTGASKTEDQKIMSNQQSPRQQCSDEYKKYSSLETYGDISFLNPETATGSYDPQSNFALGSLAEYAMVTAPAIEQSVNSSRDISEHEKTIRSLQARLEEAHRRLKVLPPVDPAHTSQVTIINNLLCGHKIARTYHYDASPRGGVLEIPITQQICSDCQKSRKLSITMGYIQQFVVGIVHARNLAKRERKHELSREAEDSSDPRKRKYNTRKVKDKATE
jgi:hypothetical protein